MKHIIGMAAILAVAFSPSQPRTQVVLLGTGTPRADPERSGPATAVVVNGTAYLVDLGPGVVRRAAAAFDKGIAALAPDKLQTAFIGAECFSQCCSWALGSWRSLERGEQRTGVRDARAGVDSVADWRWRFRWGLAAAAVAASVVGWHGRRRRRVGRWC
jgi:hypothetical protein